MVHQDYVHDDYWPAAGMLRLFSPSIRAVLEFFGNQHPADNARGQRSKSRGDVQN